MCQVRTRAVVEVIFGDGRILLSIPFPILLVTFPWGTVSPSLHAVLMGLLIHWPQGPHVIQI